MDRRTFLKSAGATGLALSFPVSLTSQTQALSEDEIERRVKELVSKMTLSEKIKQMSGKVLGNLLSQSAGYNIYHPTETPANHRLGIPGIRFVDGPRGINFEGSTCFPVAMARGASWDPDLNERVSKAMAYEGRARGANFFGGGCINLLRHPSWGRAQETFGEDPYHLGVMGVSMVKGVQNYMMACAKHFAANSIDKSRHYVDVQMDERTLREIYLPHFKMCVDSGVASIMSAYNNLNGYLCGHNKHLLREILKTEWGFKGFVISDFGLGVKDTVEAANAGLDIEMPSTMHYGYKLKQAVESGKVPMEYIDEAVTRILRQKLRFIHLEKNHGCVPEKIAGPEHTALALECAQKSIVLLKNENSILPLSRREIKTIALLGEFGAVPNIGDKGSSIVRPPYVITPLEGLKNRASGVRVIYDEGRNMDSAFSAAKEAEVVIVIAGCDWQDEGEGFDRIELGLDKQQVRLIHTAVEANPRTIVVLMGGSAITMQEWLNKVPAILMAWYPGMEGGNAIADILFGEVNPSGKLPINFPKSAEQIFKFDNKAKTVKYDRWHGYRYFDRYNLEPEFPFGFGLSYTQYQYKNLRLDKKEIGKSGKILAKVDVINSGKMSGEEIVQLYVGYNGSQADRPVKELKAFKKIQLAPGEAKTVELEINAQDLAYYNESRARWDIEEIPYTVFVGPSSRQTDLLTERFKISGA